jgi:Fe2+ or Zn2+ uptake regulation protein
VTARTDAELVRKQMLDALAREGSALTTAELRRHLNAGESDLVNEVVYRNLLVLERRGKIRRLKPAGRHVAWEYTTAPTPTQGPEGKRR